jgi:hypothetical protein
MLGALATACEEEPSMLGFVEVIVLLLGLSNFGLQPNPNPPTADASLQYAIPDADVVLYVDAATFVPNNYKALTQLGNQPQIKASPDLSKMVREMVAEIEGGRGIAKSTIGIDPTTDISSATLFLQFLPNKQDPLFVAAVRGKFTAASIDKIAKLTGKPVTKIGGGVMVEMDANDPAVGLTKDGVLLAGTPKLVRDRLGDAWKAPARPTGGSLAHAAEAIGARPVFAAAVSLSATARKVALDELGPKKNFASDLIQRHKVGSLTVHTDGIGWTWIDRDRAGLENMAELSQGVIELMRAGQIAPRGMAKILLAGLASYRGTEKMLDEVLNRKADIMKIVESYSGDGNFKVKLDKNPATNRLDVRASGKTLSEVVPAGLLIPIGAFAAFGMRHRSSSPPPMEIPTRTEPARPGSPARPMPPPPAPKKGAQPAARP